MKNEVSIAFRIYRVVNNLIQKNHFNISSVSQIYEKYGICLYGEMGVYLLIHIITLAQELGDMNLLHAFLVVEIVLLGSGSSNVNMGQGIIIN